MAGEQNRWCVEGQWQISGDAKMVMTSEKMARLITKRRVTTGSLHRSDIHGYSPSTSVARMAQDRGASGEEMVREFYASYLCHSQDPFEEVKALASGSLTTTLVRGCGGDISHATIRRFLYDGEACENGFFAPRLGIRKATLTFVAKFFGYWCERGCATKADNQVTWRRSGHGSGISSGSRDRLCQHRAGQRSTRGIQDFHDLPLYLPYFRLCGDCRDEANVASLESLSVEVPRFGYRSCGLMGRRGDAFAPSHRVMSSSSTEAVAWAPVSLVQHRSWHLLFRGELKLEASDGLHCYTTFHGCKSRSRDQRLRVEREDRRI
ncbi:hypothetical protein H5410_057951 [Solanum commersonii]|uniref:Uncharacterized protein n=1 Tax=Solanum commersonii TaxID=4109 RepID=A0A9J5WPM1_SOLCO|nr:hypothetical protein H5410_057951 [Solanum commersonii]